MQALRKLPSSRHSVALACESKQGTGYIYLLYIRKVTLPLSCVTLFVGKPTMRHLTQLKLV